MDRRSFLIKSVAAASALRTKGLLVIQEPRPVALAAGVQHETPFGASGQMIADDGWRLWPDRQAAWQNDTIYLPEDVRLDQLPVNAPTGGWSALSPEQGIAVTLPATVEQFYWGKFGLRPYSDDYGYSSVDHEVKDGNYLGVSWWWRPIDIPAAWKESGFFYTSARPLAL